jgi:threonine dehydrogenase-like Zn-dependent dehydrogenase
MVSQDIYNVDRILATESDPRLPPEKIDLALMVDAYHEFSHPREVMEGVVASLAPGGRVVLVEYRGEDPQVPIKPLHKMTLQQVEREMTAVGLALDQVHDELPLQHVIVFRKQEP